jgi:hypothetical protein
VALLSITQSAEDPPNRVNSNHMPTDHHKVGEEVIELASERHGIAL